MTVGDYVHVLMNIDGTCSAVHIFCDSNVDLEQRE